VGALLLLAKNEEHVRRGQHKMLSPEGMDLHFSQGFDFHDDCDDGLGDGNAFFPTHDTDVAPLAVLPDMLSMDAEAISAPASDPFPSLMASSPSSFSAQPNPFHTSSSSSSMLALKLPTTVFDSRAHAVLQFQEPARAFPVHKESSLQPVTSLPGVAKKNTSTTSAQVEGGHGNGNSNSNSDGDGDGGVSSSSKRASKKRKMNPTANLTEAQRRALRLERNRNAAQESRDRKKAYLTTLETEIGDLRTQVKALTDENASLRAENAQLRVSASRMGVGSMDMSQMGPSMGLTDDLTEDTTSSHHSSRTCSPPDTPERQSSHSRSPSPSPFGDRGRKSVFLFAFLFSFAFLFGFMGLEVGTKQDGLSPVDHTQARLPKTIDAGLDMQRMEIGAGVKTSRVLQAALPDADDAPGLTMYDGEDFGKEAFSYDPELTSAGVTPIVTATSDKDARGVTVYNEHTTPLLVHTAAAADSMNLNTQLFCPTAMHVADADATHSAGTDSASLQALRRLAKKGVFSTDGNSNFMALISDGLNGLVGLGSKPRLTDMFANGVTMLLPKDNFAPEWSSDYNNNGSDSSWAWETSGFNMVEISCEITGVKFLQKNLSDL
jgi:hypothetical protein